MFRGEEENVDLFGLPDSRKMHFPGLIFNLYLCTSELLSSYHTHVWSESCVMIGQIGWKKIVLIRALKHLADMLLHS